MTSIALARPATFGELIDVLEDLTTAVVLADPTRVDAPAERAIRRVFIADDASATTGGIAAGDLAPPHERAVDAGAQVVLVVDPQGTSAAARTGIPSIGLASPADAAEAARRLRGLSPARFLGQPFAEAHARDSVVAIADRIADRLGGHVIVEDSEFQLLAYSRLTESTDVARREAILQRQLPGTYQQVFNTQGVLARLASGEDVVRTEGVPSVGLGPRLIVAIRRNRRLLGTIWLARETPAFTPADEADMESAARDLSSILVELLREREDERLRHDDAVLALLGGEPAPGLELPAHQADPHGPRAAHVLALAQVRSGSVPTRIDLSGARVYLEVTARAMRTSILSVIDGDILYAVHLGCAAPAERCVAAGSRTFAERVGEDLTRMGAAVAIGVGRHGDAADGLADSAREARATLGVLVEAGRAEIATVAESWPDLTIAHVADLLAADPPELPPMLRTLLAGASARQTEDRRTLAAVLDHWGDVARTADALHVHQNTVRYRIQRLSSAYGLDLKRPTTRLALWLLIRREAG